jgi:hypothetical protein
MKLRTRFYIFIDGKTFHFPIQSFLMKFKAIVLTLAGNYLRGKGIPANVHQENMFS